MSGVCGFALCLQRSGFTRVKVRCSPCLSVRVSFCFGLDSEQGTLNFLALYISSILESLNFLRPGC